MSEKISIIGGAGFLGTRLAHRLEKSSLEYKIFDLNKPAKGPYEFCNIEDCELLNALKGSDIIINLAAIHRDDVLPVSRYDDVNVQGSINVCNVARKHNINTIIFTSSVAIYGFAPENTGEDGDANFFNNYGRTKYLAEQVYKNWQSEDPKNRKLVILRPTVIFGEGNRGNVYNLLNQIASKRFIMFGKGKNIKSMAYVENVAAFIEYCLAIKPGCHIFNYIDKPDFDMNSLIIFVRKVLFRKSNVGIRLPSFLGLFVGYLADFVSKIYNKKFPISKIRIEKFLGTTQFSSSISQTTKFVPPVKLEEGLNRTLNYEFLEDNSKEPTFDTE
jgi:GlcNAc-P-P-Und epimerase